MDSEFTITPEEFVEAAKRFCEISNRVRDSWRFYEDEHDLHKSFIKKDTFLQLEGGLEGRHGLLKAEYVVFYNLSYGVPSFSFNVWNSSGVLLSLEDIRQISLIKISQKDFYSVITQQEHPLFLRPYFVMHPCHTALLLTALKEGSKNIIVTFLGLITPLLKLNLSVEYGK